MGPAGQAVLVAIEARKHGLHLDRVKIGDVEITVAMDSSAAAAAPSTVRLAGPAPSSSSSNLYNEFGGDVLRRAIEGGESPGHRGLIRDEGEAGGPGPQPGAERSE